MLFLSKTCVYAIQALIYLSSRESGRQFVSIKEVAKELDIPFHFLSKIMQTLTEQNILESERGAKGGIRLAAEPHQISLFHIVGATDGLEGFRTCVLGLPNCGFDKPCAVHDQMLGLRDQLRATLQDMSLEALGGKVKEKSVRIKH